MKHTLNASVFVGLLILLASCATLPRPSTPQDGVLVIVVEHNNETNSAYFGNYKLAVKQGEERYAFQTLTEERALVTTRVPGGSAYSLETEFWYESGPRAGTFNRVQSVVVPPGEVVINDRYIEVSYVDNEDGTATMRRRWYPLTDEMRAEIVAWIKADPNLEYWTFNG
jgi:hypothetical protein